MGRTRAPIADLVQRFERDRKVFLSLDCKEERSPEAETLDGQESLNRTIARHRQADRRAGARVVRVDVGAGCARRGFVA